MYKCKQSIAILQGKSLVYNTIKLNKKCADCQEKSDLDTTQINKMKKRR